MPRFISSAASPSVLLLSVLLTGFPATAYGDFESPPPCNFIHKALTTGSRFERNRLVEKVPHAPKVVVDACAKSLLRAFRDPLRQHLAEPSPVAQALEQAWLVELLSRMEAKQAGRWLKHLDIASAETETLRPLLLKWASEGTSATPTTVDLLLERGDRQLTNAVLHALYPSLLQLEGQSVTGATWVETSLSKLKFERLINEPEVGTLWAHGNDYGDAVSRAELLMVENKPLKAFHAYAEAASVHSHLLALAGLYAESFLLPEGVYEPLRKLGLPYSRCREGGYEGQWRFGPLWKAAVKMPRGELYDTIEERKRRPGCGGRSLDNLEASLEIVAKTPVEDLKSRASLQRRIVLLEKIASFADDLSRSGRQIQANEVRMIIWGEVADPTIYRYLGGATDARDLQKRVRDWLPFPPKPKVSTEIIGGSPTN